MKLVMKVILMIYLNQFILQLYQTYKNILERFLWIIDSVIDDIYVSKHNPLAGSSYIKLPKELNHSKKGLINIQNFDDNECFKWCLVKYRNPTDNHPLRIRNIG